MTSPLDRLPQGIRDNLRPESLPSWTAPMLATLTDDRFSDPDWIFERKLDGVRCLAFRSATGAVRLMTRNQHAMHRSYPEVADAIAAQADADLVVDGEIVAFRGRLTSFERLQGRSGITDPQAARVTGIAVYYYIFDVLHLDGYDTTQLPLTQRKRLLRAALTFDDPLRYTSHRIRAGEDAYARACSRGDEGVIAKRADAPYTAGRSPDWLKFKCVRNQELVVGGYTAPKGSRIGLGALLLGYYDGADLVYAGKVGTGFDTATLARLHDQLVALNQRESPFSRGRVREKDVRWAQPQLVVEVGFTEWTRDGMLRHPRFLGVRTDKDAGDVVREQQ